MNEDKKLAALARMREPFAPNQISKLCRSTKRDNPKGSCKVCGGYHGLPAIALDYVGHAALTDRLLECDPLWTWEPLAVDATGYPVIDRDGGMWIKLTVAGVTRLGYGDAQGKTGGDAMKERIGDALRNAAMRFGAALDLWHKGDLHVDEEEGGKGSKEISEPTKARVDLLNELGQLFHSNRDEMADALRNYSEFIGKDNKPVFLTLAQVEKATDNEKMHKWFGKSLAALRKDSQR